MKLINIVIVLLSFSLFSSAKWHELDNIKYSNSAKDFNLKSGIEYIELDLHSIYRNYSSDKRKKYHHIIWLKMGKKPLKSFGKTAVATFKKYRKIGKRDKALIAYNNSNKRKYDLSYYNAYMLDSNGRFWFIENRQELIDFLKPIDTPQEASLVMLLNGYSQKSYDVNVYHQKYKKIKNGYSIIETYEKEDKKYGGCIEYKYRNTINKQGVIKRSFIGKKSRLCKGY